MPLDYATVEALQDNHPAWRLLRAEQAPLIISFFHKVFITPNVRVMAQSDLAEALEDELFAVRERLGAGAFPKNALNYLNDWSANEKGWLRKFYPSGADEPHFDLTPSTEKAITWLASLIERTFVGTESRLLTLFELLRQISQGSEIDPQVRIAELKQRREKLEAEMKRLADGEVVLLDDTAVKDRFQQFVGMARELLSDFREVEHNFRALDRHAREKIALWDGSKGALLQQLMGERDEIVDTDQGRSFRAFWDFLMSQSRQEELTQLLERILVLPAVASTNPDVRLKRIHYDWLEAGEHTQRTVAQLSQQLRRFLDDATWLENRRIMDILHDIEARAITLRGSRIDEVVSYIEGDSADIDLPMERPLYVPRVKPRINNIALQADGCDIDAAMLFSQLVIDKAVLLKNIRQALQDRTQITLTELLSMHPLEKGLAELVAYLQLATDGFKAAIDESVEDVIEWNSDNGGKRARLPRVIFVR